MTRSNLPRLPVRRHHLPWLLALGVLSVLMLPSADAADGDPLIAGSVVTATNTTGVFNPVTYGFIGTTAAADGTRAGVLGRGTVVGNGVEGDSTKLNGVYGHSGSSQASGVYGENLSGGFGVAGRANGTGVAVLADSTTNGVALRTTGTLQFQNRSGIATVLSDRKTVVVTLAGVTTSSMVTATVQRTGGFFVQAAVPANGSFTIYLNKAPVAPATVKVAYLVLN